MEDSARHKTALLYFPISLIHGVKEKTHQNSHRNRKKKTRTEPHA